MEKILKDIKELKSPYEIGLELIEIEQQIEKLYKKHEDLIILKAIKIGYENIKPLLELFNNSDDWEITYPKQVLRGEEIEINSFEDYFKAVKDNKICYLSETLVAKYNKLIYEKYQLSLNICLLSDFKRLTSFNSFVTGNKSKNSGGKNKYSITITNTETGKTFTSMGGNFVKESSLETMINNELKKLLNNFLCDIAFLNDFENTIKEIKNIKNQSKKSKAKLIEAETSNKIAEYLAVEVLDINNIENIIQLALYYKLDIENNNFSSLCNNKQMQKIENIIKIMGLDTIPDYSKRKIIGRAFYKWLNKNISDWRASKIKLPTGKFIYKIDKNKNSAYDNLEVYLMQDINEETKNNLKINKKKSSNLKNNTGQISLIDII